MPSLPTLTSKPSVPVLQKAVLTIVFAPRYMAITADTNHSSTPNLRKAHLITSLGTLSKAFPNLQIRNKVFLLLSLWTSHAPASQ